MLECGIDADAHDSFFTAFSESIMNAYEHGNLAITFDIKHELIKNGSYEEELLKKEKDCDKNGKRLHRTDKGRLIKTFRQILHG